MVLSRPRRRRRCVTILGTKIRAFAPLPNLSLEELVPKDNFYRRLQATLDLSFVRELVRDCYAPAGRPSVDPVVFFKLRLVLFFEGLRSERQLMEVVADRLNIRWYLGYDLDESLSDHSSLTRIRERYGLEVFRRFFEGIVQECFEAGLVWGEELFFDSTRVEGQRGRRQPPLALHSAEPPQGALRGDRWSREEEFRGLSHHGSAELRLPTLRANSSLNAASAQSSYPLACLNVGPIGPPSWRCHATTISDGVNSASQLSQPTRHPDPVSLTPMLSLPLF